MREAGSPTLRVASPPSLRLCGLVAACETGSMKSRLYDLKSSWTVPFPRENVWAVIADPDMSWPSWWPHCSFAGPLERTATSTVSLADRLKSTTAHLNFHAPLGYTLTISIHPTNVEPLQVIEFDAGGHLVGTGRVALSEAGAGQTHLDIEWRVRPTQGWMNLLGTVASPVFKSAHGHMMSHGEEGLIRVLQRRERL